MTVSFTKAFLLHLRIAVIIGVTGQLVLFLFEVFTSGKDLYALNFVLGNIVLLIAVILFYRQTTIFPLIWKIVSLVLNIILTAIEFGFISLFVNDDILPNSRYMAVLILAVTASILFAFNKTVLDRLFKYFGIGPISSAS